MTVRASVVLALLLAAGCAGGDTARAPSAGSTTGIGVGAEETGVDSAISASGGWDSGADDSSGGDPGSRPGLGVAGLVSAGGQAASRNYSVVFTLGQSSVPTGTHASSSYTVRGGIVGANGSPP